MTGPSIRAIGLAVPPHTRRQSDLIEFMIGAHGVSGAEARRLRALYNLSRIETRYSCLPDFGKSWPDFTFFPKHPRLIPPPPTSRRMEAYREHAPALARAACEDLLARTGSTAREAIEHLFVVSCTGFFAPGLDVLLTRALGLRPDVGRSLIGFQGCQGGLTALRLADYACRARPGASALIVCVELCSLHFQNEATEENLLANALFSDGAAAVLVSGEEVPAPGDRAALRMVKTATALVPETGDQMVWRVGDAGFELRLSGLLPRTLATGVPGLASRALGLSAETLRGMPIWAVHPGGAAILDGLEKALELPPCRLTASREVLRRYGNMSSPTIFFVLREILDDVAAEGSGVALAFGPGLTVEATQFLKVPASGPRPVGPAPAP